MLVYSSGYIQPLTTKKIQRERLTYRVLIYATDGGCFFAYLQPAMIKNM